ncbi:IclR family transcriptional regulator [Oricola sp.]|uniref:IclR family transcriptional regulator n=1 Tax=Oricola sp. TaxID=1979950 RepID=UPI0025D5D2EE|nr:IclR family transcriptional regulator [Oricola sp.]
MRAVKNAIRIVQMFEDRPEWGVTELAEATGMDKAMTHRILKTLMHEQWVEQNLSTRRYSMGAALLAIASGPQTRLELLRVAEPVLEGLCERLNETVVLSGRHGLSNTVEYVRESMREVRVVSEVGRRIPLYCGAAGKALLAFDHPSVTEEVIAGGLKAYTPKTIVDPDALRGELKVARDRGWSFEEEEYSSGASGVGAPVWNSSGCITASIALRAPTMRMSAEEAAAMAPHIMRAAAEISRRLGYKATSALK